MNNLMRNMRNSDGTVDTLLISSNDGYTLNLNKKYKLANKINSNIFKNSILGSDIGYKSQGFASITILSAGIAVLTFVGLILSFRI